LISNQSASQFAYPPSGEADAPPAWSLLRLKFLGQASACFDLCLHGTAGCEDASSGKLGKDGNNSRRFGA
ncbi:MAG: hypothetical protein AAGJ83_06295, partial [Planctomycetota bacterium]